MPAPNTGTAPATRPQPRTDLDLAAFKTRLEALKADSAATVTEMKNEDADGLNDTGSDRSDSSIPTHGADVATELQLRTQDAALMENERNTIRQIDRALEKIADGTYGYSDRSGKPIPAERLEAMPFATVTVEESADTYLESGEGAGNG